MMYKEDFYVIKPNKGFVIFCTLAVIISLYCLINGEGAYMPYHHNVTFVHPLLSSLVLFATGRKYVINQSGVSVYLLGIKLQTVYWYDVREVCIVHQKALGNGDYRVYIFRNGSPYGGRDPNQISMLSLVHPIDVLSFMVWDGTISECRKTIEEYYNTSDSIIVIEGK